MKSETLYISDLDGTLLTPEGCITPYSKEIINQFIHEGGLFTIATARGLESAIPLIKGIDLQLPLILHNGVLIYVSTEHKYILKSLIPIKIAQQLSDFFYTLNIHPLLYGFDHLGQNHVYFTEIQNISMKNYIEDRLGRGDPRFMQVASLPLQEIEIIELNVIVPSTQISLLHSQVETLLAQLSQNPLQIHIMEDIYTPGYSWLEIGPSTGNKQTAITFLKSYLASSGILVNKIVCFGDNTNDLGMFELADKAFAVANAVEMLKEHATGIIRPNYEDGIAHFLKSVMEKTDE